MMMTMTLCHLQCLLARVNQQERVCSPNDVRLDRIESRQVELEDQLKRFKQKEDDEIRRINCQLQLSKLNLTH